MDTAGVERVDFNALGGADMVTVNDLTGTDVNERQRRPRRAPSAAHGDGQTDHVIVNGTNGNDKITVTGGDATDVRDRPRMPPWRSAAPSRPTTASTINGLAGDDAIDASGLAATGHRLDEATAATTRTG